MVNRLSLSEIYDLAYGNSDNEIFWIHPSKIDGYSAKDAREIVLKNNLRAADGIDDTDAPDILLTMYLCDCLNERNALIKEGKAVPTRLNISIFDYIDSLIYLIKELESSFALHILGATYYNDDGFFKPTDASSLLKQLKTALISASNREIEEMLETLVLEIFHVCYPWEAWPPRFESFLDADDLAFIREILSRPPWVNRTH
jgi:hypothetical protein